MNDSVHEIEYFERHLLSLLSRFELASMGDAKEKEYRKKSLTDAFCSFKTHRTDERRNRLFQLAHELESYIFLESIGNVIMSSDRNHVPGPDYIFDQNIYIECVCSSLGDIERSGFDKFLVKNTLIDYGKKNSHIKTRFSSSLCDKKHFYYNHVGKSITPDSPYIIFLSPGMLMWEWFPEKNGIALTDVLLGRGNPSITINNTTGEIVASGYSHMATFTKWNGEKLNSSLFYDPGFGCVSGILLAIESMEPYTTENTFLFINPFATIPVSPSVFGDIIYWAGGDDNIYRAYKKGKVIPAQEY